MKIKELFKPYLNVEIGDRNSFYTRVLERPGLWMPSEELRQVIKDLRYVVSTMHIGDLDYGILKGSQEDLNSAVITIIYDASLGKPVAFNALRIMTCNLKGQAIPVIHLGLTAIDPNARSKGFSWILYGFTTFILFFKNRLRPVWMSNVTQVPSVLGMCSESFGHVFPNPRTMERRTFDHLTLAREIMNKYRFVFGVGDEAQFNEEHFIIENSYTGGSDNLKKTYEEAMKHRNVMYNDYCKKYLDYNRGDDFLQIGQINWEAFYHYLVHSVPKGSMMATIYKMTFSLLESFITPFFHWYITDKTFGVLRARGKK